MGICGKRRPDEPLIDDTVQIFDDYFNVQVGTECETNFHGHRVGISRKESENFTHIIDLDNYEFHKIIVYDFLGRILQSVVFRSFILILVLVNAILIGMQTVEEYDRKYGTFFIIVDHVILSIFIFEILLKWAHDFHMFWVVNWNILDFLIVLLIVASSITPNLANSRALMIIRVVRAFRSLRSVSSLSSLAVVTHTIFKSMGDMTSILIVLFIFMVVFSIMGVTLFDVEQIHEFTQIFNSPLEAWYLLFVCITQDGWAGYMEEWRDQQYFWLLMTYMIIAIAIGAFIFSNLIIAVVVANLEMGVAEIRADKIANMNPLVLTDESFRSYTMEILSTNSIFATNNYSLRGQRPMKLPVMRTVNLRKLIAYVQVIAALEQNQLEQVLIQKDLERVMKVLYINAQQLNKSEKQPELIARLSALQDLHSSIRLPQNAMDRVSLLDQLRKEKET